MNIFPKSPRFNLDSDAILPPDTRAQIDECLARLKYHRKIYSEWNFKSIDPSGLSAILNFYGPPGTGKTLTAEALAGTLGLQIIFLGIAELESKFMGETAKNIQTAFSEAAKSGAILFFDEADTLLGKRLSSVTQGVDNEVNAMRSTLLIELERYEGIVIFATNFAKNYDEAFRSRIAYHIKFNLPDFDSRKLLWSRMFIAEIPIGDDRDLLIERCTELSDGFSGREIRTCMRLALPKALIESETTGGTPQVTIEHIRSAISQIKTAQVEVASHAKHADISSKEASLAKNMLGVH